MHAWYPKSEKALEWSSIFYFARKASEYFESDMNPTACLFHSTFSSLFLGLVRAFLGKLSRDTTMWTSSVSISLCYDGYNEQQPR